ncbi:hypothetical protein EX30DRAFT_352195 [Ascodesmis nigricans]|uniref:Zn(2)-C6 fungal-type domain-containing protein n=1 Tax=Ascodesmis nigricans TaxID=341454 RepID=A0A4S2MJ79_9PEZI|nr:hypothetical protein EX30DRAFT_352195 [Ascodesmis nigricans]
MSYPQTSAPSNAFNIYVPSTSGYSSASDLEGSTITDYSDHETGYSSTTSAGGFDFLPSTYQPPSARVPPYVRYSVASPTSSTASPPAPVYATTTTSNAITPPAQQSQTTQYQRIARFVGPPPVALACTECRSRHLKCDAGTPSCSRCLADKRECTYVKSRRGWKGTRRKKVVEGKEEVAKSGTDTEGPVEKKKPSASTGKASRAPSRSNSISTKSPPPVPTANFSPPPPGPHTNPLETLRAHHRNSTRFPSQQEPPLDPPPTANLMQLYYSYFHDAHPFCLPPVYLIKASAHQLTALLPAMRYIASSFAPTAPTAAFCREAENALFGASSSPPRNPYTVQALILFAIGLHAENEPDRANQVKDIAADLALELGMNHQEFSQGTGGEGELGRVLEESWRRTWWELYFLDGVMAALQQKDHFKLWSVECTVPLPCEEHIYASGKIPEPHSLKEFDERYFADEPGTVFSSFAYRVEAVRILGQVLAAGGGATGIAGEDWEMRVEAAEASLVNWGLHLPAEKRELVRDTAKGGGVDEMLFQAHMVVNAATIYLNRPKSHLTPSPPTFPPATPTNKATPLHTARTLTAANTLSKLLTLPTPLIKHTPLFTSFITLACIIHLSACSWLLSGDEAFLAKERIRLGVGGLRAMGRVWGVLGGGMLAQVRFVAREVLGGEEGEEEGKEWFTGVGVEWDGT